MRVVAGRFKGHRLSSPRGPSTRPTADRVREAIFNLLGPLDGSRALDLYAGSGALGIEALSRGAASATLVDSDPRAIKAARDNLARLGAEAGRATRSSVPAFLRAAARRGDQWDLAFCDPPYRLAHRLGPELAELLPAVLGPEARVVCESSYRQPLELRLPLLTERRYGDTLVSVYGLAEKEGDAER